MSGPRILAVGDEFPPMTPPPESPARSPREEPKGKRADAKRNAGDRFEVLNAFIDFSLAGLTRAEVAVWLVLYRDTRNGTARTSYDDIARRAGINRRSVGRSLRRLESRGLMSVVRRGSLRCGPSSYRVLHLEQRER